MSKREVTLSLTETPIIKGLQDLKEGRITRFKDAEELADYLRNPKEE